MLQPIRIVVADDHPIVREGLVAILGTQPDFAVVGEASNGADLVRLAGELRPDVVLLDLEMPELDGVEALRRMRRDDPALRAIVFTVFDTDDRIVAAVRAGAQGYLLKGAPREEVFTAIRTVSRGGSLLQPVIASKLLRHVSGAPDPEELDPLTPRELEVLRLLGLGRTNKEIASDLAISERTVKFHLSAIYAKLGAGNRTEAVAIATRRGLIDVTRASA